MKNFHFDLFCWFLGFGQSGPYQNRGGYDNVAAAIGGLMHITGPRVNFRQHQGPINLNYMNTYM